MNSVARAAGNEFLESWLKFQARQGSLPGFVVTVTDRDETIFSKAFGHADAESGELVTTEHLFNIGSQAKMITATAVLQLDDRGLLSLDEPVARYLPWLTGHRDGRFRTVSVRQLLWHGSGIIRDGKHADYWQLSEPFPDVDQLTELVMEADLVIDSGTKLKYSNLGYALLGQIVEAVANQQYGEYVADHISSPLDLQTLTTYADEIGPQIATSYTRPVSGRREPISKATPTNSFTPATGWYATTCDMAKFLNAQLSDADDRVLSAPAKSSLWSAHRQHWQPRERRGTKYGLGFAIEKFGRCEVVGHSGGFVGYRSCSYAEPDSGLGVFVMANAIDAPIVAMAKGIFGALDHFERYATGDMVPERARLNVRLANLWETLEIVATNDRIVCINPESWTPFDQVNEELIMETPTELAITKSDDMYYDGESVTFLFNEADEVVSANYAGTTVTPEGAIATKPLDAG